MNKAFRKKNIPIEDISIKVTWFNKLCFRVRRFIKLIKVAFHFPYMIKAVLTTKCPHCGHWLSFPIIREQNTRYQNDFSNYFCGCKYCREINDENWESIWEDYYRSVL